MIDILVMTCNKYAHLTPKWFAYFERTWTLPYRLTYIMAGDMEHFMPPMKHNKDNTRFLLMKDNGFAANLLDYLADKTDPFLMMMDDFMLFEVDNELIGTAYNAIHISEVGCVRLVPWPGPTLPYMELQDFGEIDKSLEYSISMQASFWKPQTFRDLLDRSWNPWQIEVEGSKRARDYGKRFIGCKTCAVNYKDYMMRGKPRPEHAAWVDEHL